MFSHVNNNVLFLRKAFITYMTSKIRLYLRQQDFESFNCPSAIVKSAITSNRFNCEHEHNLGIGNHNLASFRKSERICNPVYVSSQTNETLLFLRELTLIIIHATYNLIIMPRTIEFFLNSWARLQQEWKLQSPSAIKYFQFWIIKSAYISFNYCTASSNQQS